MRSLSQALAEFPADEGPAAANESPFANLRRVRIGRTGEAEFIVPQSVRSLTLVAENEAVSPKLDDVATLIARARAEEAEAYRIRLEEALAAKEREFEPMLEAKRREWVGVEAEALCVKLEQGFVQLEAVLSERIANVLADFLEDGFRDQALRATEDLLKSILADCESAAIRVAGPEDLLASLKGRVTVGTSAIEFVPTAAVEVSIAVNDALIETRLGAWGERLAAFRSEA